MTYPSPDGQPWGHGEPVHGHPHLPAVQHGAVAPFPPPAVPVPYGPPPAAARSAGAAVALELVLGLFGVFGVGNIYAGRKSVGVVLMVSFWALFWVNVVLIFLVVGMVTMPLTWVAFLILGPISAARGVEEHNARLSFAGPGY